MRKPPKLPAHKDFTVLESQMITDDESIIDEFPPAPALLNNQEARYYTAILQLLKDRGQLKAFYPFSVAGLVVMQFNWMGAAGWIRDMKRFLRMRVNGTARDMKSRVGNIRRVARRSMAEIESKYQQLGITREDFQQMDLQWPGDIKL